jgi:hypothetical protein
MGNSELKKTPVQTILRYQEKLSAVSYQLSVKPNQAHVGPDAFVRARRAQLATEN